MKITLAPCLALLLFSACAPEPDPDAVERKMIRLQERFPMHDTDDDDHLSPEELKQAMIKSGVNDVTDTKVRKVTEFYDFNKDGKISLRETQSGVVTGAEALIDKVD